MLKSKQMSLEAVITYAISPETETPSTLPELVYIDPEEKIPTGTLEYFIVSDEAEDTTEYLTDVLIDTVYPQLYFNQMPDISKTDEMKKFPLYYLMFRQRKFLKETVNLPFAAKTQKWQGILENLREVLNSRMDEFGMKRELDSMSKYDMPTLEAFEREYKNRVEQFKKQHEKKLVPREEFDKLPSNAVFTEPQTIKAFITYAYTTPNQMDVKELFNYATVSRQIPFLTCAPFYKIYSGAQIFPVWNVSEEDSITGYVRVQEEEKAESYSQFQLTDASIRIESYDKSDIEESGKKVLEAIRAMFPMIEIEMREPEEEEKYPSEKIIEEELYVETFFVDIDLNLTLFKHFICTHPILKNFYFIDESIYLVRKKNYLLLNYFVGDKSISLFIGNRYLDKPEMVETTTLDANRCHTRLYIRRCDRSNLITIIQDMSRCLLLYKSQQERLTSEFLGLFSDDIVTKPYREECPRKSQADSEKKDEFILLWKDAVKRNIHRPVILDSVGPDQYLINPQDTEDPSRYADQEQSNPGNEQQNQEVFYYPSKKDSDRMPQRLYTCEQQEFKFIGLTDIKSKEPLPYIPNCFKESQSPTNKPTSKLSLYLKGEKKEKTGSTSYVIKTGKQLLRKQVGEMLELVDKWTALFYPSHRLFRFGLVDYQEETQDFGVDSKYRSSSVLYLLEYYIRGNLPSQVNIEEIRKRLIDRVRNQNIYTAESFRYSKQELEDILKNNHFIDPRLFYHILKDEYQCDIFMFTKDEKKSKTPFYLTCSYFHNDYVEVETESVEKFIMIAINKGGEFDPVDFPICEIVADKKATSELSNIDVPKENYNYPVSHLYYKEFNKAITDLYGKRMLFHPFVAQPIAQTLNTFGKVSWLHYQTDSQKIVSIRLYVPIHSLELPVWEEKSYMSERAHVEEFLELESSSGRLFVSPRLDTRGKTMGIFIKKEMDKVEYRYYIPYGEKEQYSFRVYQLYEKVSRMVMEYTYYLFSIFLKEKGVLPADDLYPLYREFSDNHFLIDSVKYKVMERRWTLDGNPMLQPNPELNPPYQIVVSNETVKVKLMYLLRQKFFTNPEGLMEYYKLTYMPNYYTTIADFDAKPRTIIFEKEENLVQYQKRMNQSLDGGSFELKMEETKPYMLYRLVPELQHHTFLIQPARSLGHAVFICDHWNKKGVNLGEKDYELEAPCTKFVWTSEYEYTIYPEKGGEQRFVALVNDGTSITYQSMLPYKVV
jgi:hypothetical protein